MRESKKKKSRQAEIHQREDVVAITGDSNDDDVEYFYNNQVVLDDIDQISFQLEAEVCFRLNKTITEILGEDEEECVGIHGKEEKCALPSSLHMDSEQDKSEEPFSSHSSKHQNSSIGSSCTLSASSGCTKEYHNNTTAGDEACYCDDDGDDDDTTTADFPSGHDTTDQSSTKLGQANMYNNNNSNKTEVTSEFTYKKAWILASVAQNYL
uniref:Uncharacterized protein n=2 Tax=Heterosigma akashiwo TaxID=2829 RepID=A0A6V1NYE3_HETAK|mmetsp:Transcript_11972/g.19952  ORF Transcript_11972/g.19952 Transcript_11972/m.19952 type:complete len:210 (-) Transcript_11972:87-716(-)